MQVIRTPLIGLLIIEPKVFGDQRGFFLETYSQQRYQNANIPCEFTQDNISRSSIAVLRGLHYQLQYPQAKLVTVTKGRVFDVAVDIRQGSPNFGQWYGIELSDENHRQFFIPAGFAHGFSVLSETADFSYKCSDYYHAEDEKGIAWNDPDLAIDWQIETPLLAEKDKQYSFLRDVPKKDLPIYRSSPC
jgi:dTDP-4-dehydrorhamnose 3,5-epimerase